MKLVHTLDMNYQRITISLPNEVYEDLIALLSKGEMSKFISEATEDRILEIKLRSKIDPVEVFLSHRKSLAKLNDKQIMNAIHKGRT